jgi:hypothetical protein
LINRRSAVAGGLAAAAAGLADASALSLVAAAALVRDMELGNLLGVAKDGFLDIARLWDLLGLDDILVLGDEPLHADHDGALSLLDLVSPPLSRLHLGALNLLFGKFVFENIPLDADLLHVSLLA